MEGGHRPPKLREIPLCKHHHRFLTLISNGANIPMGLRIICDQRDFGILVVGGAHPTCYPLAYYSESHIYCGFRLCKGRSLVFCEKPYGVDFWDLSIACISHFHRFFYQENRELLLLY